VSYPQPKRLPRAVRSAVVAAERLCIDEKVEYATVVSAAGEHVATTRGGDKTVSLSGLVAQLRDATVTHNHPNGTSFSLHDLFFALRHDVHELRIVGRIRGDEVCYRLQRPQSGWPQVSARELMDTYARALSAAQDQPAELEAHFAMERVAARLRLGYSKQVRG